MRLTVRRRHCAGLLALALLATVGCAKGKTKPKLDLVPAKGTITLDGQPLADADVAFVYDGVLPSGFFGAGARTDAQGHYELKSMNENGTLPGKYKVTVTKLINTGGTALKPEEGVDMEQLRQAGMLKETVPTKYTEPTTTDLTTTVESGKAEGYNFDLKSG